jgi:DNA polymerase-4
MSTQGDTGKSSSFIMSVVISFRDGISSNMPFGHGRVFRFRGATGRPAAARPPCDCRLTEQTLSRAGIVTVGDMQDYAGDLRVLVGSFGPKLKQFAFGEDDRPLEIGDEIKSISNEETFLKDTDDRKVLRACLREQATDISARLKHRRLGAHTVQVKVRYSDFTTLTRQFSVEEPITEVSDIYRLGCFLLGRDKLVSRPLRLLGLGVSSLREPNGQQLVLL